MTNKLLILMMLVCFACKRKVETIKPSAESISESIYASGTIKSKDQYQAFATVNGIVEKIFVAEGDFVKKGSPILSIYNETQKLNKENSILTAEYADFNANQGKLNEARSLIELSRNKMKNDSLLLMRQLALWKQDIGTRVELEQRELAFENAKNIYQSAKIRYDDLKRQLDFTSLQAKKNVQITNKFEKDYTILSEMDGIVYSMPRIKGDLVGPQTALAVIGAAKQFVLEMQVDEYDILKIKIGLPVLVTMDSYKGKVFEAKVTKVNPLMNERSKTFLVEAAFDKVPETLYPNISFEANIVIQTKEKVILIPRNYILNDSVVFKANGEKVVVKTGLRDYQKIEIISGISLNDELVKPAQ